MLREWFWMLAFLPLWFAVSLAIIALVEQLGIDWLHPNLPGLVGLLVAVLILLLIDGWLYR